ncbi:hypothetical protein BS47DRAFT_1067398 [Hydnum rufescens UP504]|uniref:Uncharacterized protein n=1 Tax=Hydnum rufescens UP504 TaxID=1448309 RepID=A0A9P6AUS7_9AGAM|nr:hypothetical protein BS47DRAFT_1067398 [Hydnum rufescens UP504]
MALNILFLVQLAIYFTVLADSDPLFLRIIVYLFSILDIFQTATMACVAWNAYVEFLHPRTFLSLYATIRSWNIPISVAVYGFYTFQIRGLTGSWKIPGAVMSLVVAQIVGCIMWTVGTVAVKLPMDLGAGNGMTTAGTVLCTLGASGCSACVMMSMILIFRNDPLWRPPMGRDLVVEFQIISARVHVPLLLVSMTDLISYLFFPRSHVSMIMAIIIGKVWSNSLLHGLNSRRGLRTAFRTPHTPTDVSNRGVWVR